MAEECGIGISQLVSVGNKPDVSGNDLLRHWREDGDVGDRPRVAELDVNPFLALPRGEGSAAVDARVRLHPDEDA